MRRDRPFYHREPAVRGLLLKSAVPPEFPAEQDTRCLCNGRTRHFLLGSEMKLRDDFHAVGRCLSPTDTSLQAKLTRTTSLPSLLQLNIIEKAGEFVKQGLCEVIGKSE